MVFPLLVHSQADTISSKTIQAFTANSIQLNDSNLNEYLPLGEGDFLFSEKTNFRSELEKLTVFNELKAGASAFYKHLNGLSLNDKQNLIRYFSYHQLFIETQLHETGLPEDLKYFAPALSAMNQMAVGKNNKAGIWQLSHFQAMLNGLEINRLVDERFNEQMATEAVVLQLKENSKLFESTELAVLGYLIGNAKLKNTLARCEKNSSLSDILKRLPDSVSETIAGFQAMSVFLRLNTFKLNTEIVEPDLVTVNRRVHFQQISQVLNIPEKELQFLNPQYRYLIIPGNDKPMKLKIPAGKYDEFVLWTDSIYNAYDSTLFQVVAQNIEYPPAPNRQYLGEKVKDLEIEGKTKIKYSIKSGDVLGFIAEDYDVRVADLKYWNNIYNERRIQVGQKLDIFVDDENADYYSGLQKGTQNNIQTRDIASQFTKGSVLPVYKVSDSAKKVEHVVKSGESPYVIAKKYAGVTPEAILEWNGILDARKIQIGQKLIIYLVQ